MGIVCYTLDENSELTNEQRAVIEKASKKAIVFDEDCPELTIEQIKNYRMRRSRKKENAIPVKVAV